MRILTVCSSAQVFGAETVTLRMLAGFERKGHEQVAVTTTWTDGAFSKHLQALGIREVALPLGTFSKRLHWRPMWWTLNTLLRLPAAWRGWARLLRQFKPDVILWTSPRQPALLLPFVPAGQRSFLIEFTGFDPNWANQWMYRRLVARLTGFVAVSEFMVGHLKRIGAPADKIFLAKSGTFFRDELAVGPARAARVVGHPVRVGIVGQISAHKGHDDLVAAVQLLRERGKSVAGIIFGSGAPEYVEALKAQIDATGMKDAWTWMGYESDKARIYGALDICVVPSRFGDPFPTVAMEAGAYGLPVVATRAGGLPEIIQDGITGLLCEPASPGDLAAKIEQLVSDPELAERYGSAGRRRIMNELTIEHMVERMEDMFAKAGRPAP